jgi:RimK family alpha-L-glutamate ligase
VAVVASPTRSTEQLVRAWRLAGVDARVLGPGEAEAALRPGDVALFRLDVLPTLDGVEPGLEVSQSLERRGVRVLNRETALLAVHDKLRTAELLVRARVPHPRTVHLEPGRPVPAFPVPCVVKPRFGSWGSDVALCRTSEQLDTLLASVVDRPWWRRHGALLQRLVPPCGHDLRLLVADGAVVGSASRTAAAGEWRTNRAVGGTSAPAAAPESARALAVAAARAAGIDFCGVDLLPEGDGWIVLELNGAVDFDARYSLAGRDVYADSAAALSLPGSPQRGSAGPPMRDEPGPAIMESFTRREAAMPKTMQGQPPQTGDLIEITGHSVGDAPKRAEILEVLGEAGHEHFRVRWEDGHESIFFPGEDAVIRRPARKRGAAKK